MSTPFPVTTEWRVAGVQETLSAIGEISKAYREGALSYREVNRELKTVTEGYRVQARALSQLRMVYRTQHAELLAGVHILRTVGSIGRELVGMWQAWSLAQWRVEERARDLREAQESLIESQRLYNQYVHDFGRESIYALGAYERMTRAEKDVEYQMRLLGKAQKDSIATQIMMGIEATGIVGTLANLAMQIQLLQGIRGLGGLGKDVGGLSGAFGSLSAVLAGLSGLVLAGGALYQIRRFVADNLPTAFDRWREVIGLTREDLEGLYGPVVASAFDGIVYASEAVMGSLDWVPLLHENFKELKRLQRIMEEISGFRFGGWPLGGARMLPFMGGRQLGGPIYESGMYYLHRGEAVTPAREPIRGAGIRNVYITQYNTIAKEVDADLAGERMFRRFMEKLGQLW